MFTNSSFCNNPKQWLKLDWESVYPFMHTASPTGRIQRVFFQHSWGLLSALVRGAHGTWHGLHWRGRYPGIVLSTPALWVYMFDCFQGWIPWDLLCECPETPKASLMLGLCMFFRSTDDQNRRHTSRGLIGWDDWFWWLVYVYFYILVCSST